MNWILEQEAVFRLSCFVAVLLIMSQAERLWPRRSPAEGARRWTNLAMVVVDTVALRLLVPFLAVGIAALAASQGWGLFNITLWPPVPVLILSLLLLDLALYVQHWLSHRLTVLWRLHRMHHSDVAVDVTTAVRFHPFEIILSMLFKMLVVVAFGIPVIAVILFEVILNAAALFNHSNVSLPASVDRVLRRVIVTPDMHRVHHSIHLNERDSNFGFCLSVWDRLFRTYTAQPRDGHGVMTLGLPQFREAAMQHLPALLLQPFMNPRPAAEAPVEAEKD